METLYSGRFHGFPNFTAMHYGVVPEEGVLSLIVVLTTSVSLVALVFAFITYSLFSDLRNLMGTTVMTLLATTFMTQLIYVIGVGGVREKNMCQAISHSLQFLHLCLLSWLLVLCKDTMSALSSPDPSSPPPPSSRRMCVKFAAASLWAWGAPAAHVAATFYAASSSSLPALYKVNCWFIEKRLYLLFYGFPAVVLLSTCACLMVRARIRLAYTLSLETRPKHRARLCKTKTLQVSLCSKLTANLFVMDIFGFIFVTTGYSFAWIGYNVAHSLQGLIMALCSTCNSQVLSVYTRRQRRRRSSAGRLLSTSSNLNDLDWSPLPSTV